MNCLGGYSVRALFLGAAKIIFCAAGKVTDYLLFIVATAASDKNLERNSSRPQNRQGGSHWVFRFVCNAETGDAPEPKI